MGLSPHHDAREPRWKRSRHVALWWAAAAALCVWCGCAVTRSNYSTLSFFFDGVPNPDAPGPGRGGQGDSTVAMAVVVHKPFAEEKCEECHKTKYRPNRNDPSACFSCHTKLGEQHAWTHGAVAGGACLWCHAPHESTRKWLLRSPDRALCMQCHAGTLTNGTTVPAHVDPKVGCLECHFGHGGPTSLMLKPGATAQAPPQSSLPIVPDSADQFESLRTPTANPPEPGVSK